MGKSLPYNYGEEYKVMFGEEIVEKFRCRKSADDFIFKKNRDYFYELRLEYEGRVLSIQKLIHLENEK